MGIKYSRTIFPDPRRSVAANLCGESALPVFFLALFFLLLTPAAAHGQSVFFGGNLGSVNVGSANSSPASITFAFKTAATLGSVAVLTQGVPGLDFTDAQTGTCTARTAYAANATCTVNINFAPKHPGARYGAVELLDPSGNLLSTGYIQGTGVGPQVTFAVETQGNFVPASPASLGSGFSGYEHGPAVDGAGNVFVADILNNAVKEIVAAGGYTTVNSLGSGFDQPNGVAVDGAGNVFVADSNNYAVKEIVAAGGYTTVNTLVSKANGYGPPACVAVDGAGNVFAGFVWNGAVYEFLAAGGYTTVNTLGKGIISDPYGVAVDGAENVFVADVNNNAVYEIPAAGGYKTVNTLGSGFYSPEGVTVDAAGDVFVEDGVVKEVLAVNGVIPANPTILTLGWGIGGAAVDGSGNVFVADGGYYGGYANVFKYDYADAPTLTFDATLVGSTSTDSPQTVAIINDGNAPLAFPVPATGENPAISSNFTWNSSAASSCPLLSSSATAATLPPGAFCNLPISFTPAAAGTLSGQLALTENTLNIANTTQDIALSGVAALASSVPTTTAVTSSVNPYYPTPGVPVIFTATVTAGSGPAAPTGTVQFSVNGSPAGSPVPLSRGVATYADNTLKGCGASITAAYTPSGGFAPSISPALIEGIVCVFPVVTNSSTTASVNPGGTATYTFTLSPPSSLTSFPAAVTFSASGGPAGSTYSFTPSTIAQGAAAAPVSLAVTVPATMAGLEPSRHGIRFAQAPGQPGGAIFNSRFGSELPLLALLLLPAAGKLRRAGKRLGSMAAMLLLLVAGIAAAACLDGCTSSPMASGPVPSAGNYTINITATSGSVTQSITVGLTVN